MNIIKTDIEDLLILEPRVFGDNRGWFTETYSKAKFQDLGIDIEFVQDNHSMSAQKGTLRGLHFQTNPKAQSKLVRCTKGRILDVAVDLRKGSATYKKWVGVELSEENKNQLLIPKGFAHGFYVLSETAEFVYKCTDYYNPQAEHSLLWNDATVGIDWHLIGEPSLSAKDLAGKVLENAVCFD